MLEEADVAFKDDAHLMRIIERIVSSVGGASTSRARWWTPAWPTARA